MCLETFLWINASLDLCLAMIAARFCRCFSPPRVAASTGLLTAYGTLAFLCPTPLAGPLFWCTALLLASAILAGTCQPGRVMAVAFTMLCSAMLIDGGVTLLSGIGLPLGFASGLPASVAAAWAYAGLRSRRRTSWLVALRVRVNGREARFPALIDTGNRLREPLTGLPVLIAEASLLKDALPDACARTIDFSGIGGCGSLRCFRASAVWFDDGRRRKRAPDAWIAVSPTRLPGAARALAPCEYALYT